MKKLLLATAFCALAAPAYAACTITNVGILQFYSACHADNQANDGDDVKMFVDKTPRRVNVIDGSLGSNDQAFANVIATANSDFETDGSGFANFQSVDHGSTSNTLTSYIFAPNPLSFFLPNGDAFNGFDGQLFRGQIDNTGTGQNKFNGELFVVVTLSDGTEISHLYDGLKANGSDFGVLGFDEQPGVDEFVRSVFITVNDPTEADAFGKNALCVACGPSDGAFNEFKQIEFSVPGQVAVIPEPRTWVMMAMGFGLLGLLGFTRKRASARFA